MSKKDLAEARRRLSAKKPQAKPKTKEKPHGKADRGKPDRGS